MMVEVEQPFIGKVRMYGSPLKFSETPSGIRGAGPLLGQHNEEIYCKRLGYSQEKLEALRNGGVI